MSASMLHPVDISYAIERGWIQPPAPFVPPVYQGKRLSQKEKRQRFSAQGLTQLGESRKKRLHIPPEIIAAAKRDDTEMSELFPIEQVTVRSPRLIWCERHSIDVHDYGEAFEDEAGEHQRWVCGGFNRDGNWRTEEGDTEDEAIAAWAKARGIPLWNEVAHVAVKRSKASWD